MDLEVGYTGEITIIYPNMSIRTHTELIKMKKEIINRCYNRQLKWKEAAKLLCIHPKSLSRLKKNYEKYGECVLIGRKPGPKHFTPDNRTPENIEKIVEDLALMNPGMGPVPLADKLSDDYDVNLNQATIYRILKRRNIRYTIHYQRWKQAPTLYCLDEPGVELQLDGCYPYGRSRKIVCYDSLDDCSRWAYGRCYPGVESDDLAIRYVSELVMRAPFRIQAIRVDNRYGKKFEEHCKGIGINVIRNDAYSPEQNGKIERFHKTSKRELFWQIPWGISLDELNYQYGLWLNHYNYSRRHGGFGMNRLTPAKKLVKTWLQLLAQSDLKKVTGILQQYKI